MANNISLSESTTAQTWASAPWRKIILAGAWFFLIMVAYYVLKALRDAMASPQADLLNRLYLATFAFTLLTSYAYSLVVSRASRGQLVFWAIQFFVIWIAGFLYWIDLNNPSTIATTVYFVWVSVFNLFVVAIFWSVMADAFSKEDGKLWFGSIAAGGSLGSIAGSFLANTISKFPSGLLVTSIVCLEMTLVVAWFLMKSSPTPVDSSNSEESAIGGSLWSGLKHVFASRYLGLLCLYVVLGKFAATFIYNNLQLVLKAEMPAMPDRISLFATMNLWTQGGSLLLQAVVAGFVMKRFGVGVALAIPSLVLAVLFGWLGFDDSLSVFAIAQVTQQIVGYGLMTPAQHVLFTVVSREDKFQSKGFIDTVVFRFSDVAAGNVVKAMEQLHSSMSMLSLGMLPLMMVWFGIATYLGSQYAMRATDPSQRER